MIEILDGDGAFYRRDKLGIVDMGSDMWNENGYSEARGDGHVGFCPMVIKRRLAEGADRKIQTASPVYR